MRGEGAVICESVPSATIRRVNWYNEAYWKSIRSPFSPSR